MAVVVGMCVVQLAEDGGFESDLLRMGVVGHSVRAMQLLAGLAWDSAVSFERIRARSVPRDAVRGTPFALPDSASKCERHRAIRVLPDQCPLWRRLFARCREAKVRQAA